MSFTFNGVKKDYLRVLVGLERPAWAPIEEEILEIPGRPGGIITKQHTTVRRLNIPVRVYKRGFDSLEELEEDLAAWLVTDEPKPLEFDHKPNRVYYAKVTGELIFTEYPQWADGVISFICPDPYKYGPELEAVFPSDVVTLTNRGTVEAEPVFELTAKKKTTFALISNGEEYNMIGSPAEVEQTIVDEKTRVLYERGDTLNTWTTTGAKVDGNVSGSFTTDGTGIVVQSYGTGERWHGPALLKEIEPIQDFEVAMRLRVESTNPSATYRLEFYLFDEYMNMLGKMAIMDASQGRIQYAAEARVGPFVGVHVNYLISSKNYLRYREHFHGMLRMRRIGQRFEFYVARIGHTSEEGHIHHDTFTQIFHDVNNEYQGRLRYVEIHIGKFGDTPSPTLPRINAIEVFERKEVLEDETPYIIYPGDIVTFDHKNADILINGESRADLKQLGASFFKLKKGENRLVVS
ncbi:MAG: phage tail family protein, partial [Bacillales bacterium]